MTRFNIKAIAAVTLLWCSGFYQGAIAQQSSSSQVDLRYETLLKDPRRNLATPGQEFGDKISPESGSLQFSVVDVSVPGNSSLPVEFRRELYVTTANGKFGFPTTALADWELGLPRIEASYDERLGWSSSDPNRRSKNCSISAQSYVEPPPYPVDPDYYPAKLTWNPPSLMDPTSTAGGRLLYNKNYMPQPSDGKQYYWLVAGSAYFSCLPTLKNAGGSTQAEQQYTAGEGFLLQRADGVRIWFDWMALKSKTPVLITKPFYPQGGGGYAITDSTFQLTFQLYPTRMEDRFGNWVNYTYANKSNEPVRLTKITSNDGRVIDVVYDGNYISQVVSSNRTWTYQRSQPIGGLARVINPDGSYWEYGGTSHNTYARSIPSSSYGTCVDENVQWNQVNTDWTSATGTPGQYYFSVKNPAGATATFYYAETYDGRSNVPKRCYTSGYVSQSASQVIAKSDVSSRLAWWGLAVVGKKVTGPGLSEMWWRYSYQPSVAFAPAVGTKLSKELTPDGTLIRRVYGNQAGKDEGLLLSLELSRGGAVVKREQYTYLAASSGQSFPKLIGFHPNSEFEYPAEIYIRPQMTKHLEVDGKFFDWRCGTGASAACLDAYGRPITATLSSSGP